MFILKPKAATIQAVNVVPRLAPKTTPRAFFKLNIPAPRKASTSNVTIELLCKIAVTNVPESMPFQLRLVKRLMKF